MEITRKMLDMIIATSPIGIPEFMTIPFIPQREKIYP